MKGFPKIFVPSLNREDGLKVVDLIDGLPFVVLLHDEEQLEKYQKNYPDLEFVVTNIPIGDHAMIKTRNFVYDNLVEDGEWFMFLDDNNDKITRVDDDHYGFQSLDVKSDKKFQDVYSTECTLKEIAPLILRDISLAERTGVRHIGFAPNPNYFFRPKKYGNIGYSKGNATITKKNGLRWDENLKSMDDYSFSAQHIAKYGRLLLNYFICFHKSHYSKGGIGTQEERLPMKLYDCKYLIEKYDGLLRYSNKKGAIKNSDLAFRIRNMDSIKKWRAKFYEKI